MSLSRRDRRVLAGIAVLSFLLNAVPFWWGLPTVGSTSWAFDEIAPSQRGKTSVGRHHGRYPPLHYKVLRAVYAPVRLLVRTDVLDWKRPRVRLVLRALGRLLSAVLATGLILLLHRTTYLVFGGALVAHVAAAVMAFSPTLVYYGKTINLEAPYLFWFGCSLVFFWRALSHHRLRDYVLFALTATLAVCTKDQAYGLYVLPALILWLDLARDDGSGLTKALVDRRLLAGLVTAAVSFALIHNLVFDPAGFRHHVSVMLGRGSQGFSLWESTLVGHMMMAWQALVHLAFLIGLPAALVSIYGLYVAWHKQRRSLLLLAFPVSYYLFFVVPIMYHYDRFLLPMAMVVAIFSGLGLVTLAQQLSNRWLGTLLIGGVLAFALARAVTLDAMMWNDARYSAEAWVGSNTSNRDRLATLALYRHRSPRTGPIVPWHRLRGHGRLHLRTLNADYLIWNADEAREIGQDDFTAELQNGSLNYRTASTHRWRPALDLLRMDNVLTNLRTVDPEIVIVEKIGSWGITRPQAMEAIRSLWNEGIGDWQELARAVWSAPVLQGRTSVDEATVMIGQTPDGRTQDTRPAFVVLGNESAEPVVPVLRLRIGKAFEAEGVTAVVRYEDGETTTWVPSAGKADVVLPSLAPGELVGVLVAAEDPWRPVNAPERHLGVRIRRIR